MPDTSVKVQPHCSLQCRLSHSQGLLHIDRNLSEKLDYMVSRNARAQIEDLQRNSLFHAFYKHITQPSISLNVMATKRNPVKQGPPWRLADSEPELLAESYLALCSKT
jgi:hypothetical protein